MAKIKQPFALPTFPLATPSRISTSVDAVFKASVCAQIAAGLQCLSDAGIVHRDLAARNVLLCSRKGVRAGRPIVLLSF